MQSIQKSGNFLNQLESMMSAVKKEAASLENMKSKIKELEELRVRFAESKDRITELENDNNELRRVIRDHESLNGEIRADMQRLNDIYNADRLKHIDMQQANLRLEQELSGAQLEKDFFSKEAQKSAEMKKAVKGLKAQLVQAKQLHAEEEAAVAARMQEMEQRVASSERSREESAQHLWNLTEVRDTLCMRLRCASVKSDCLCHIYMYFMMSAGIERDEGAPGFHNALAQRVCRQADVV